MRYLAYLFVGLVLWGLADDFLIGCPGVCPRAFASDDDEYLLGKSQRTRQEDAEHEKSPLSALVPFLDACSIFAKACRPCSTIDLRASRYESCLYVFMSLQI